VNKTNEINRRVFVQASGVLLPLGLSTRASLTAGRTPVKLRLGGPVPNSEVADPESWVQAHKIRGYRAAYCPLQVDALDSEVKAYRQAAAEADIVIAEVGAFGNNPISRDRKTKEESVANLIRKLELAERIGASCCVNTSGSRGQRWSGPDPADLTEETFEEIVEVTVHIIDAVKPTRTAFTLETMPWCYPDSTDSYEKLIHHINKASFAVHFDPVNLVSSPQRYFNNGAMIRDFFQRLGPRIRSCHGKDILLQQKLTTHLDEVMPGKGNLDYDVFLSMLAKFSETPVMLEHLKMDQYPIAAKHLRTVAERVGVSFG
jgi:sugar phosphate isomerase/epimerase